MNYLLATTERYTSPILSRLSGHSVNRVQTSADFFYLIEQPADVIVLDVGMFAETYPWEYLMAIHRFQPDTQVFIILDLDVIDSLFSEVVVRLAGQFGFCVVPANGSDDDPAQKIFSIQDPEDQPSSGSAFVVTILSASPKDGATTIAYNTAYALATKYDVKVGLLDLNLKNPELAYMADIKAQKNNARLRPQLITSSLTTTDLLNMCDNSIRENLYLLFGTSRRDTALDMTMPMIRTLLETARKTFDVIFIDAGSAPDNAATIGSVRFCNERWLVSKDNMLSGVSWNEWHNCYWRFCGLDPTQFSLIVNQVADKKGISYAKELGVPHFNDLPAIPLQAMKAIADGKPLYSHKGKDSYSEQISYLVDSVATKINLSDHVQKKQQNLFLKIKTMMRGVSKQA